MAKALYYRAAVAAAVVLGAATLPGCGGGGSSSSGGGGGSTGPSAPGGAGTVQSFGALTAHIVGTAQPPVVGGSGSTVITGVGGASITALQAAQPPSLASTLIAFDRQGEVYSMAPDGSNVTELTKDLITYGNATAPSWGAAASKIAYMRYDPSVNYFQIYVALGDGTSAFRLTNGTNNCANPCVSPNGTTVLFDQYNPSAGVNQIYSIPITGGTATLLNMGGFQDTDPSWSPDGSKFAFTRYDTALRHDQIYIANANGSSPHSANTNITNSDLIMPAWSPDGTKIAFVWQNGANYHVYEMSALGNSSIQTLTNAAYDDFSPAWSPDGGKITFSRKDASGNPQIYIANADGTQPQRLTDGATIDQTPAWSPIVTKRYFVGPGYALGTTAAGFLYAQQGDNITSLLTFNATTPSGATIASLTGISPSLPNIIFTISSTDSLTSLIYLNGLTSKAVPAIGSGSGLTSASNAVVSFNAATGLVASVLPYTASHIVKGAAASPGALQSHVAGSAIVIDGKFLAAMDAAGHNKAPQGATEVRLDSHTGAILSVQ